MIETFANHDVAQSDDIASLRSFPDVRSFDYVDVSAIEAHRVALVRWPLLLELESWYQDQSECGAPEMMANQQEEHE